MILREDLKKHLKESEGFRGRMYKDTVGKWTIGYGFNLEDSEMPEYIADMLLEYKMDEAHKDLVRALPWVLDAPENVRFVLWDMCYNMGIGNSKRGLLSFKNTLRLIKEGDYVEASQNMLKSKWADQVGGRALKLATILRNT